MNVSSTKGWLKATIIIDLILFILLCISFYQNQNNIYNPLPIGLISITFTSFILASISLLKLKNINIYIPLTSFILCPNPIIWVGGSYCLQKKKISFILFLIYLTSLSIVLSKNGIN